MKKILTYIMIIGFLISCGGDVSTDSGTTNASASNGNYEGTPCTNKPVAEDGETPPTIPDC